MNRLSKLCRRWLLLLLWLPLAAAASTDYQEGVHYQRLENPVPTSTTGGKVEVVEVFWYGCPHCFRLEPDIEQWLQNKPENVEFVRVPAALGRGWEIHARAFHAAEILGVLDKIHKPLFDAIHEQGRRLNTPEALADFFAEHGVDKEQFMKVFNSFELDTQFRRSQQLVRQYAITGVPALIVDGKYLVTARMAGSEEGMLEVVNYLVRKESGQG